MGHVTERLVSSGAVLLVAGVATLTRHWGTAVLAVTLPCAVFLLYWWYAAGCSNTAPLTGHGVKYSTSPAELVS